MNNLRSEFEDEPQYDYAYSNDELSTPEEKRQEILNGVKGLVYHVARNFTDAGMKMGANTQTPKFNDSLSVPDHLSNARNPLQPNSYTVPSRTTMRRAPRKIRNMRSSRLYPQ